MTQKQKTMLVRICIAFLLFLGLFIAEHTGGFDALGQKWLPFVLCLVPYLLIGYDIIGKAARNICHGQVFDENFLMMIATFGAFVVSEYIEAVAVMLLEKGAKKVYMLNRTIERAQVVAEEVNGMAGWEFVVPVALTDYAKLPDEKFLVIQATNIGMHPKVEDVVIEDEAFYQKVEIGYDLIFNPGNTKFMKLTKAGGGKAYNGAKMLVYQGIIAYELWNNIDIAEDTAQIVCELVTEALNI